MLTWESHPHQVEVPSGEEPGIRVAHGSSTSEMELQLVSLSKGLSEKMKKHISSIWQCGIDMMKI